jgi:hypothetical protein
MGDSDFDPRRASPVLTLRFTLTRAEISSVYRRLVLRGRSNLAIIAIGLALAAYGAVIGEAAFIVIGATYVVGWIAFLVLVVPLVAWRRYQRMGLQQSVIVSRDGVTLDLAHARSTADWTVWRYVRLLAGVYVIRARYRGYCLVPQRVLADTGDEPTFRAIVAHGTGASFR